MAAKKNAFGVVYKYNMLQSIKFYKGSCNVSFKQQVRTKKSLFVFFPRRDTFFIVSFEGKYVTLLDEYLVVISRVASEGCTI